MRAIEHIPGESCTYDFKCEGCGSEGQLVMDDTPGRIACPEGCSAVYVQWYPEPEVAELKCVVCPVYAPDFPEVEATQ